MLPFMRRTISTHMLVFESGWIFVIPRTDKVAAKDLRASKKVESAPQDEGQPRGQRTALCYFPTGTQEIISLSALDLGRAGRVYTYTAAVIVFIEVLVLVEKNPLRCQKAVDVQRLRR